MPIDSVGPPATSPLAPRSGEGEATATATSWSSIAGPPSSSLATSSSTFSNPVEALPNGEAAAAATTAAVSKRQLKRERRWEKKLEIKKRRKLQDKEVREARAKAQGRDLESERQQQAAARALAAGTNSNRQNIQWEREKSPLLERSFQVCVDCAFEEHMTAKEINSLAIQLRYCYSENRRNPHPCRLTATSVSGTTLGHLQNVAGFEEWGKRGFTVTSDSLEQYYGSGGTTGNSPAAKEEQADDICTKDDIRKNGSLGNVVYLTSDSDTVLHDLDDAKIYVIGGIVDRNRLRRATLNRATVLGVATARLPIDEHLQLGGTTRVLTVNTVFELLLRFRQHNRDWKKALLQVLPPRKHAQEHAEENKQSTCTSNSKEESSLSKECTKVGDATAQSEQYQGEVGSGPDRGVQKNVAGSRES